MWRYLFFIQPAAAPAFGPPRPHPVRWVPPAPPGTGRACGGRHGQPAHAGACQPPRASRDMPVMRGMRQPAPAGAGPRGLVAQCRPAAQPSQPSNTRRLTPAGPDDPPRPHPSTTSKKCRLRRPLLTRRYLFSSSRLSTGLWPAPVLCAASACAAGQRQGGWWHDRPPTRSLPALKGKPPRLMGIMRKQRLPVPGQGARWRNAGQHPNQPINPITPPHQPPNHPLAPPPTPAPPQHHKPKMPFSQVPIQHALCFLHCLPQAAAGRGGGCRGRIPLAPARPARGGGCALPRRRPFQSPTPASPCCPFSPSPPTPPLTRP